MTIFLSGFSFIWRSEIKYFTGVGDKGLYSIQRTKVKSMSSKRMPSKLPEVSDKKKGRRMRNEKGTSRQKEEAYSLSASDQ